MGVTEYIGARYVPIFQGYWREDMGYDALDVVMFQGNSYTARKPVPAGVGVDNAEYWIQSGNYDAQTEVYRRETKQVKAQLDAIKVAAERETEQRMSADTALGERITANGVSITALGDRLTTERGEVDEAIQQEATNRQNQYTHNNGLIQGLRSDVTDINTRLGGINCGTFQEDVDLGAAHTSWQPAIDAIMGAIPNFNMASEPVIITSGVIQNRDAGSTEQVVVPFEVRAVEGDDGRYREVEVTLFTDTILALPAHRYANVRFAWLVIDKEGFNA